MKRVLDYVYGLGYQYLRPEWIYESIIDIDYGALYDDGIRNIFFDIDNTIIPYMEEDVSIQYLNLFNKIKSVGFDHVILLSNNSSVRRINKAADQLKLPGVAFACKPFTYTARRLMVDHNMKAEQTVTVGDQILTDILLGNYLGIHTIFVDPMAVEECSMLKKLQYKCQDWILGVIQQRGSQ
jgi:uncharacterized protein